MFSNLSSFYLFTSRSSIEFLSFYLRAHIFSSLSSRHATRWSGECESAETNHQPAVLTTGALRSRLSLKYHRVQFGWFGVLSSSSPIPIPTTVLSLLSGPLFSLVSSLLTPSCSILQLLSILVLYPTPGFPFCGLSVVRTPTKLHPLAPSSCPIPSHHRHLSAARASLPNPIPPILIPGI